jgi:3-hydroxyisobutyrate dehydrogenase
MRDRSFPTAFPLRGAAKDAALIAAAGRSVGVDMAVADAVARRMQHAVELGHGDKDMAATYLGQHPG